MLTHADAYADELLRTRGHPFARDSLLAEGVTLRNFSQANKEPTNLLAGKVGVFKKLWRQEHRPCAIQRSNSRPGARLRLTIGHLHCACVDLCLVHIVFFFQRLLDHLFPGEQLAFSSALRPPPQHLTTPILQEDLSAKPHPEDLRQIRQGAIQGIWLIQFGNSASFVTLFGSLLRATL